MGYTDSPDYYVNDRDRQPLIFGDHTRIFYIPEDNFSIADNVKVLSLPAEISREAILYLTSAWKKAIPCFGYARHWQYAKEAMPILPLKINGELDFSYMEQYVRELEAERVRELEAERVRELEVYLVASGLNNYQLYDNEKEILTCKIKFKTFKIGELFEKLPTKFLVKGANKFKAVSAKYDSNYCVPTVYAKFGDNGIMYWSKRGDFTTYKNVLSVIYNGAIAAGLVYAQEECAVLAEAYVINLKNKYGPQSFNSLLYMASVIKNTIYPLYSRDLLAVWGRVQKDIICLPVNLDSEPDFSYMDAYIGALKKVAIKDVVDWKDRELAALKSVIGESIRQ